MFDLHENIRPSDSAEGATLRSTHHFEPEHQVLQTEIRHLIEQKLDTLPHQLRLVFILRAVEEMPATEIAIMLDIPEATVRTRFFRARQLMQEALSREIETAYGDVFAFDGGALRQNCSRGYGTATLITALLISITHYQTRTIFSFSILSTAGKAFKATKGMPLLASSRLNQSCKSGFPTIILPTIPACSWGRQ